MTLRINFSQGVKTPEATKKCSKCGQIKQLDAFPIRNDRPSGRQAGCKECLKKYNREHASEYKAWCDANREHLNEYSREYNHRTGRCSPMSENKQSSLYLGVCIAETALCSVFKDAERMPFGTPGYDILCDGIKIDVKCSTKISRTLVVRKKNYTHDMWRFKIGYNKTADVFAFIALNDRTSLTPVHVWLVPGAWVNAKDGVTISNSESVLMKWKRFEINTDTISQNMDHITRCFA